MKKIGQTNHMLYTISILEITTPQVNKERCDMPCSTPQNCNPPGLPLMLNL